MPIVVQLVRRARPTIDDARLKLACQSVVLLEVLPFIISWRLLFVDFSGASLQQRRRRAHTYRDRYMHPRVPGSPTPYTPPWTGLSWTGLD